MAEITKARTHTAFALKREGKTFGRWLEIGNGRIEGDCVHVFLDRTPVGGFSGYVRLVPIGTEPPLPRPEPQRVAAAEREQDELGS